MLDIGASLEKGGGRFRVWAPGKERVSVVLEASGREVPLERGGEGYWSGFVPGVKAGVLYKFRVDGDGPFPDPGSRFQPKGVHGGSQVVDPSRFRWTDGRWAGVAKEKLVFYELHVGTFTPKGTLRAAGQKLSYLKDLGVTAVELMPLADFPGERNWGYDGVGLFAPARCYGTPEDLRRFVDRAHGLGIAVFLDVVYNHFGPDGNYTGVYSPYYVSRKHKSPWGATPNLDGPHSRPVRDFFIDNALHWLNEYHIDGLRLDATHALMDDGPVHFLAELADRVAEEFSRSPRRPVLIAEDSRNLAVMLKPRKKKGWGMDGVWADDLHHQIRVALAGDRDGYYADYGGTAEEIARTLNAGWFYHGQKSKFLDAKRGSDPSGIPKDRFVVCLQNHDQVGNRAFGERLHHQVDAAGWRAATALLLCAAETPLLFMGQEWAASAPFLFFTDHNPELGRLVTQGRREEFKKFKAFSDPKVRANIPDPQAESTFQICRLDWGEKSRLGHDGVFQLTRSLLRLRARCPDLAAGRPGKARSHGKSGIRLRRGKFLLMVDLSGGETLPLPPGSWRQVLSTEDRSFAPDPSPVNRSSRVLRFTRPGAVLLERSH